MSRQAVRNTEPELCLRRALHELGLGYRLHRQVLPDVRRSADIVFVGPQVAVFVDGCFWHGCEQHKGTPRSNAAWWAQKISRNRERDAETDARFKKAGWLPVRVWEHEDPAIAAKRIARLVRDRRDWVGKHRSYEA